MTASGGTTMRGCAPSSTSSASTTSSSPRPTATGPASSTRPCSSMLARYDAVMKIMLPTLREERAATYSPFLPIHPRTRIVMQVPIEARDVEAGTIAWSDPETGERFETPGHRRPRQAAMEAGLGDALGRARHRLRDGGQGPDRFRQGLLADRARARRARRRRASTTSSSSTSRARRSRSRRATA